MADPTTKTKETPEVVKGEPEALTTEDTPTQMTRAELRSLMFSAEQREGKREPLTLWGAKVEYRVPQVGQVLDMGADDSREGIFQFALMCIFLLGTDELVFETADRDMFLTQPFDAGMVHLAGVITKMAGEVSELELKNLSKTGSDGGQ